MTDLFYFTYNYGNSDYYSGYGYANTGTYTTGQTISGGTNELGLNGYYTIDFLISGASSSAPVGNIYTYAYYDGDTSKKSYSTLSNSQGVASGTNGIGSESDYIFGAATGYDLFGLGYYEADAAGIALYSFTYDYGNGDYYNGYVVSNDVAYQVGSTYDVYTSNNQAGYDGKYTINGKVTGYDSSYSSSLGQVYVYNYYDGDTGKQSYTPYYYSLGLTSGTGGLGSENDYVYSNGYGYYRFGQDYYEADAAGLALYSFTYNYGNGDYYNGYVVAADVAYKVGSTYDVYTGNNQAGYDGKYTINGIISLDSSYTYARGYVFVNNYYDGDTSQQNYTPYYYSQNLTSGTGGLGSEDDYIYSDGYGYYRFGQDYYEADAAGLSLYSFTYNYGNGDYYNGYVVASSVAYQVGSTYDLYTGNNQAGYDGKYTINGVASLDSSYAYARGYVFVNNYYDGDTSKQSYTPYYYSQNLTSGTGGLGSELDYAYGGLSGYSLFGQDYYEADVQSIALYSFTYDYGNGDYYNGYVVASDATYQVGSTYDVYTGNNQAGYNGKYTINGQVTGYDSSYNSYLGQVYVYNYYDGDTSQQNYTPYYYSQNLTSGTGGLGSEIDYIYSPGLGYSPFGIDYYEADAAGLSLYSFTYNYGNGDYYNGYVVASDVTYQVGSTYDIYTGNNQAGYDGKYTINGVASLDSSYAYARGYVYVNNYYDGDTSQQSYTPYYYSQNLTSGTGGLGSELDYIYGGLSGYSLFGQDYYEADVQSIALYSFTYNYGNGDYYNGFVIASDATYQVGSSYDLYDTNNQAGYDGNYTINGKYTGYDSSYNSLLGQVYVYNYYDGDTSQQSYTPYYYSQNLTSGTGGLGSEIDYIYSPGLGYSPFGLDYYEADAAGLSLYSFTYDYGNGDYYNGYVVASNVAYQVGSTYDIYTGNNQAGYDGKYTINGIASLDSTYAYARNYVYVYNYYDGDTSKQSYTPYYYSQNLTSGTGGLGSELDYIYGGLSGYSLFGQDYYEADAQSIALYSFTYDYGNGDYYNGFVIASDATYQVGSTYDVYTGNNQAGYNGKYTINGKYTGYDSSYNSSLGQVYVYNYYDGGTSQQNYTPYYYSQNSTSGTGGLGTERDYIITYRNDLDLFGYDYYEADSFVG